MRRHLFGCVLVLVTTFVAPGSANAALIGTLEIVSPISKTYVSGIDIGVLVGSALGDVTANLSAVDVTIPSFGGTTSGCEAADFAGFVAGSVALLQRGTCLFATKVANATAAGATGVIIFNEGNHPTRVDLFGGSLLGPASILALSASFPVGSELFTLTQAGPVSVRLTVTEVAPEPSSMLLLGTGLLGAGVRRWRQKRA